jgi:Ni2+-binding GTPase involved in maturation of urease and hydrogenase
MVAEIRRGIWETTGLFAEPQSPGWIAITCESRAMAEWLGAAIVLENVEARVEDDRVLLPAGPRFRLENEVKSIITVVAKTHHYGAMHAAIAATPDDATSRHGFRCVACGLDVHVSRPAAAAELDATCPIDGARMAPLGLVTAPRGSSFGHPRPLRVAVGGPGDGKTVLVDALRRRYGRRRAVVASPARAIEVNDPAIDLVLVELGEDGEAPGLGPHTLDATIGVLDACALAEALRRGDRGLDVWRLLVVSISGEARVDRSRLEEDTRGRRGRSPVVFVDLASVEGIDAIASWLQRELLLLPWRERRVIH